MLCPCCNLELVVLEFDDVEIDYCSACGGLWLDAGELGLILHGEPGLAEGDWLVPGRSGTRKCPLCRDAMRVATLPQSVVEVDYCGRRHGLWLDKDELRRIVSAEATGARTDRLAAFCARLFPPRPLTESKEGGNL